MTRLSIALIALAVPGLAHAKLEVVATVPDLAAIAAAVGGKHVRVTALADAGEDPHYVDPRPNLMLPLNKADLVLVNGLELEVGWLPPLLVGARNGRIQVGSSGYFDASTVVKLLGVPTARVSRAMGDVHPGGNPHFCHDPRAGAYVARALGKRMAELDPGNQQDYTRRAEEVARSLIEIADRWRTRFASLPPQRRVVVVYHRSLVYLNDWLGLTRVQSIEPKPGIAPSPGHVAKVLSAMKSRDVHAILQEEHNPHKTSETLAKLAKATVVIIPTGTRFSTGETYAQRIERTASEIYDALAR